MASRLQSNDDDELAFPSGKLKILTEKVFSHFWYTWLYEVLNEICQQFYSRLWITVKKETEQVIDKIKSANKIWTK